MWAAVNSETCLRRGWCQVVGGMSVYSTPSLDVSADDKKPIVVVSTSMDSRSLFHDLTVGASSDVSGMVAVLAIADALSRVSTCSKVHEFSNNEYLKGTYTYRQITKAHFIHIVCCRIMGVCWITTLCKGYFNTFCMYKRHQSYALSVCQCTMHVSMHQEHSFSKHQFGQH